MRRLLIGLAVVAPLVGAASAQAAGGPVTWRVVEATHTSTASLAAPKESGHANVSWKLAKPTSTAPNRVVVSAGVIRSGYGMVNVKGSVAMDQSRLERCSLAGSSGDSRFAGEVPAPLSIAIEPASGGRLRVALSARYAHLNSMYFGSECAVGVDHAPSEHATKETRIKASALRGKRIVLRFRGTAAGGFETYAWSTRIVLTRR